MTLIASILAIVLSFRAQARDFEMGGDSQYPYAVTAPESGAPRGAGSAVAVRAKAPQSSRCSLHAGPGNVPGTLGSRSVGACARQ
jgi:hypothetical protein